MSLPSQLQLPGQVYGDGADGECYCDTGDPVVVDRSYLNIVQNCSGFTMVIGDV